MSLELTFVYKKLSLFKYDEILKKSVEFPFYFISEVFSDNLKILKYLSSTLLLKSRLINQGDETVIHLSVIVIKLMISVGNFPCTLPRYTVNVF